MKKKYYSEIERQQYHKYLYWLYEYKASLKEGKFKNIPIRSFHGKQMITHLRNLIKSNKKTHLNQYTINAIYRKLTQYENVYWVNASPNKKPKKEFDYHKKLIPILCNPTQTHQITNPDNPPKPSQIPPLTYPYK